MTKLEKRLPPVKRAMRFVIENVKGGPRTQRKLTELWVEYSFGNHSCSLTRAMGKLLDSGIVEYIGFVTKPCLVNLTEAGRREVFETEGEEK